MKADVKIGNAERMEAGPGSGKHVLVMALSTFPAPREEKYGSEVLKVTRMKETNYFFEDAPRQSLADENDSISGDAGSSAMQKGSDTVRGKKVNTLQDGKDSPEKTGEDKIKYELRKICTGYYQLEPISWFIREELKEYVTDVILLETKETKQNNRNPVFPPPTASERAGRTSSPDDPKKIFSCKTSGTGWTAAAYFYAWLKDFWGE